VSVNLEVNKAGPGFTHSQLRRKPLEYTRNQVQSSGGVLV
jgi:hypothetical protein